MDAVLDQVLESILSTRKALSGSESTLNASREHGISLLNLKNESLLSYLHSIALVVLAKIETGSEQELDQAVKQAVSERVVLEKGIKGMESRIGYQVEKAIRAHAKAKAESSIRAQKLANAKKNGSGSDSESNNDEDKDEEEAEDEDEGESADLLRFKPNPRLLLGSKATAAVKSASKAKSKDSSASSEKYLPPKISATQFNDRTTVRSSKPRKNAVMEDYLESTSIAPVAEPSIGSTIMDGGRSVVTAKDRRRDKEIRDFEETNYTRLASNVLKSQNLVRKKRGRRDAPEGDAFFGEDWGLSGNSNVDKATSKKKKSGSLWDRAKKRRDL